MAQLTKAKINLSSPEGRKETGNAFQSVFEVLNEAAAKGEDLSFMELLKRSLTKAKTKTENQKQLPDANNTDSRTE